MRGTMAAWEHRIRPDFDHAGTSPDPDAAAAARRLLTGFRRRHQLSLEATASKLGLWSIGTLAAWEDGRVPMPLWAQSRLWRVIVAARQNPSAAAR